MAQWTNIPTDRIEPGKPIRAIDGLALRDNPIAIAEGASGAPRVQTNGIANSAVTTAKIANSAVTTAKIANSAVTTAKIANSAVTTSKIANSNVTAQKLATGGNESNWVGGRIVALGAGAVGTYAFVTSVTGSSTSWGETVPGSNLRLASAGASGAFGSSLSGTWRIMGQAISSTSSSTYIATHALGIS